MILQVFSLPILFAAALTQLDQECSGTRTYTSANISKFPACESYSGKLYFKDIGQVTEIPMSSMDDYMSVSGNSPLVFNKLKTVKRLVIEDAHTELSFPALTKADVLNLIGTNLDRALFPKLTYSQQVDIKKLKTDRIDMPGLEVNPLVYITDSSLQRISGLKLKGMLYFRNCPKLEDIDFHPQSIFTEVDIRECPALDNVKGILDSDVSLGIKIINTGLASVHSKSKPKHLILSQNRNLKDVSLPNVRSLFFLRIYQNNILTRVDLKNLNAVHLSATINVNGTLQLNENLTLERGAKLNALKYVPEKFKVFKGDTIKEIEKFGKKRTDSKKEAIPMKD